MNKAAKRLTPAERKESAAYMEFVRGLPCLICYPNLWKEAPATLQSDVANGSLGRGWAWFNRHSYTEAAHLGRSTSHRGIGQKHDAFECGPLCAEHHRLAKDSHHAGTRAFWEKHSWLDRDAILDLLNRVFKETR